MALEIKEDDIFKRMRLAICSGNRRLLLFSLNERKKSLGDLREDLKTDPATIVHALRELERHRMVQQDVKRDYSLTVIGRALVQKVIDCHCMAEVLTIHEAFWSNHDVSGIPNHLFNRIGALRDSTLVVNTQEHILKASDTFVALLREGDVLELVTSFYSPDLIKRIYRSVSDKKAAFLVMTNEVLQRTIADIGSPRIKQILQEGATINVVKRDPKLLFVFTGNTVALGLAHPDGPIDFSQLLTSRSSDALDWGRDLFHYYLRWSESVAL